LAVPNAKGRPLTLHSRCHPWEEAEALALEAAPRRGEPLVVLGLGLGFHLLALASRLSPDHPLMVVEPEAEVFYAALASLDLTPLWVRPALTLVVEPDPHLAARLMQRFCRRAGPTPRIWGHPASLRVAPEYYQKLLQRVPGPAAPSRRAPGVRRERLRVLVVNPDYFLIPEVLRAFRRLGHDVRLFSFDKRKDQGEAVLRRLLDCLAETIPDLVFTVNHLGVDREGVLMECLHRLRVPLVSWFVDSPALILNLYAGRQGELAYIFSWDPTYIPRVRELGFEHVYPLPLATDPEIFTVRARRAPAAGRCRVSFVGNSLSRPVAEKLARLPAEPAFAQVVQRLAAAYRRRPHRSLGEVVAAEGLAGEPLLADLTAEQRVDLEAGMIWAATRDYRLECVSHLAPWRPVIYGDAGWRDLVGPAFRLQPEVGYYDGLPGIYRQSEINFNATSLQMKAAVNQRVFDVPAAGGFLLTDFREQLAEVLEVGREVACYQEPGEIPDLVRFYLAHPHKRHRLVRAARERVLREHTYVNRLQTLLKVIRSTR
jgi:spore maturation protein CgeB